MGLVLNNAGKSRPNILPATEYTAKDQKTGPLIGTRPISSSRLQTPPTLKQPLNLYRSHRHKRCRVSKDTPCSGNRMISRKSHGTTGMTVNEERTALPLPCIERLCLARARASYEYRHEKPAFCNPEVALFRSGFCFHIFT